MTLFCYLLPFRQYCSRLNFEQKCNSYWHRFVSVAVISQSKAMPVHKKKFTHIKCKLPAVAYQTQIIAINSVVLFFIAFLACASLSDRNSSQTLVQYMRFDYSYVNKPLERIFQFIQISRVLILNF